jgi:hypothetical protein
VRPIGLSARPLADSRRALQLDLPCFHVGGLEFVERLAAELCSDDVLTTDGVQALVLGLRSDAARVEAIQISDERSQRDLLSRAGR